MSDHKQEKRNREKKNAFANFADGLLDDEEKDKEQRKVVLKEGIESRENVEKDTMKSSRMVTGRLSKIREDAGLSAFVGTSGKIKSPRFRRGNFVSLLARELLLIGRDELKDSGSVISISKLEEYFSTKRENWELRDGDIGEGIALLIKENMIPGFQEINKEVKLVHFRPIELSNDTKAILTTALGIDTTRSKLRSMLGWEESRVNSALEQLEKEGIAVLADEDVFFPGLN